MSESRRVRRRARQRRRLLFGLVSVLVLVAAVPLLFAGAPLEAGPLETLRNATASVSRQVPFEHVAEGEHAGDSEGDTSKDGAAGEDGAGQSGGSAISVSAAAERPDAGTSSPAAAAYSAVAPELPGVEQGDVGGTFQSVGDPSWAVVSLDSPDRDGDYAVYAEKDGKQWTARRSVLANQPDFPGKGRAAIVDLPQDLQDALYSEYSPAPAPSPEEAAREFVSEGPYFGGDWEPVSLRTSEGSARVRVEGNGSSTHLYLRREAEAWSVAGLGQSLTAAELPAFPGDLVEEGELPDSGPATVPVSKPVLEDVPDDRQEEVEEGLEEVRDTVEGYDGTVGVYVGKPGEDTGYGIRPDERFYTASVIKVPVMAAVYRSVEEGDLSLSDTVETAEEDYAGGAGSLQWQEESVSQSVEDHLWLMMTESDNVATNALVRAVGGPEYVNETARGLGAQDTELRQKVTDQRAAAPKLDNHTTSRDMAEILDAIASGEAADDSHTDEMLGLMRQNGPESWLGGGLPPEAEPASKVGWIDGVYNDLCLVQGPEGPYVISVFSKYGPPRVADGAGMLSEVSEEVWEAESAGEKDSSGDED